jgi:hypothetical protein
MDDYENYTRLGSKEFGGARFTFFFHGVFKERENIDDGQIFNAMIHGGSATERDIIYILNVGESGIKATQVFHANSQPIILDPVFICDTIKELLLSLESVLLVYQMFYIDGQMIYVSRDALNTDTVRDTFNTLGQIISPKTIPIAPTIIGSKKPIN